MNDYNLVFVGHSSYHNRGCEAIIRTSSALLASVLRNVSFVVPSSDAVFDLNSQPVIDDVELITHQARRFEPVLLPRKLLRRALKPVGLAHAIRWQDEVIYLRRLFRGCDAVLSVGGDNYTEDYGSPEYFIQMLEFAKLLGKKTVIWAASIGPFHDPALRERMRQFLQQVDLITVRESKTLEYLQSLGVSENVRLVADPAFTLEPIPSKRVDDMTESCSRPLLGINVSRLITPIANSTHIQDSFVSFVRRFIDEVGGYIIFIPHDIRYWNPIKSDHFVIQEIYDKLGLCDRVVMAPADMNAQETKYLISKCDYFIGAKTHSTIASLSSSVPTISIAYSTKAYGINLDLFGHTDYILPRSDLNPETLWQAWERLVKYRVSIRKKLSREIPEFQQRAMSGASYVLELISNGAVAVSN